MSNIPSRDPANEGTIVGMIKQVLRKHLQSVDDMLPARVIAFDRATNRVQVQLLIKLVTTDKRVISRQQIASLPVMQFGGGGCVVSFNLETGNLGWVKASDRDISIFLQNYNESPPNTGRLHDFADAVFIPDVMTGFSVPGADAGSLNIQSMDGTIRLSVSDGYVQMVAGSSSVRVTAAGVAITGTLTINGDPYLGHAHTGVTTGGGISGGVAP